jgi:3'-phosphoadenosine 5'-phosphosulfate sulfotransferase (PAPS reductase)/FAD synthetase
MSYIKWFNAHGEKHSKILEKLKERSDDEVIEYFRFDNMVENELEFCPLYKDNKKCHDYEELNCYLCACPNFRFDDDGFKKRDNKTLLSFCDIDSKDSSQYIGKEAIHQNCSGCLVPHKEQYIKKNFSRDWFKVMKNVSPVK